MMRLCDERFRAVVAAAPDSAAVIDGDRVVSYVELDERAERIADWLRDRGVGTEDVVAILVERGVDLPACVLGVWKAGAAYLALDPQAPRARVHAITAQLRPTAVLAQGRLRRRLGSADVPMLLVDRPFPAIDGRRPRPPSHPDNLAYVIHTSGSTGRPKGVGVSHRALTAIVDSWREIYGVGTDVSRILQLAGFGFDVATGDIGRSLLTGACLVMCPVQTLVSPPDLYRLLCTSGAQFAEFTPSLLRPFVRYLARTGLRLDSLRCLAVGGELWTSADCRALRAVTGPQVRLFNSYGLTESAIDNTYHEVTIDRVAEPAEQTEHGVPIGMPFRSTDLEVIDSELYIGGTQLARGYLDDPVATALRFVPAPRGNRYFRTGDLVDRDPAGNLRYLGRTDDVVKVHGVRMSLTEIQLTLAACPGVESAVVNVADGQLAAYVVPAEADIQATEVRRFLAQRLPRGMVPTRIQVVPSQPVTGSGKADVAALTGVAEPQPADLRRIWSAVLAIDDVQDEDDFFELGGDSLGAALLTARVRAELGVDLPAGVLFEHPTLMEVAALVGRASAVVPSLPAAADRRTGPLSPLQRRLWLLHQLDGGLAGYNIPIVLDLTGELDVPALTGALNDLVTRHDALRTEIASGPDPVQRVHQHVDLELARVAFRDHESARRWLAAEVRRPFDLARPPLLRAALLTLPGGGHRFVLTMHHLVSDGWTVRILLTELGHAYQARHAGRAPHFEPLPLSYLDYSTWQADQLDSGRYTRQLASWCDRLDGCPPPLRLPHPCAPETQPGHHRRLIGAALTDDLRELARESRTTLFVTLLAGFVAVLGTWTGRDDVVVGVPFGSRTTPGTEDLVGFFVNTVALRVTSAAGASFTDLVRTARASVAHAASNPDVPFDVVHHHLRRAGTELTLSTWFNYLGDPDPVPDLPGVLVAPADPPPAGALFDLNVYITDHGHRLAIDVVYDATRVDGGAAVALADQYERLLNLVAAAPEAPVAHHGLGPVAGDGPGRVAGDGPGRVAGDGPGPVRTAPEHGASDHAPVLTTVSRQRPEAVAIRSMSGAMTYAALSAWAGALGKELRDAGIGRDDLVAVYAAREPALVAAMLAIWSTGASCCVLDPAYPPQRLVEQLAAAGPVAALLTGVDAPAPLRGRVPRSIAIGAPRRGPALPEVAWYGGHVGFTSGTTGVPKVVSASGLPLARFLDWYATAFQLRPTDRFAMLSGLAHDPLLRDAFAPLRVGATLCIPPADLIRAPRELRQWLVDEQVTVLHVTPQLLRLLGGANGPRMGHGGANGPRMGHGGANGPRMDHVRLIVCGGDQLFAGDVRAIRLIAPAATVVNAYGTTETPQVMACHVIPPGVPIGPDERRIPIGTGIKGVSVVVLGPHSGPAAIGAVGRIVVRTPFLADGYGPEFDTGDLGRYLPDGQIELLGRADDQVKVAGYRLESQEIDAVVRRLPYVVDCRTVADGQQLITYAVCATAVSTAQLRSDLRPLLPGHMIPTGLVRLPSLPLTANNKLDRRALPAWHPPEPEPPARPHTALEQRIADVWCTVLDRSAVSTEANFFDLGGTSLLMAQVQGGLEQTLGRQIPMLMLFEHSTVRSLAAHLANGAGASTLVARRRSRSFADAPHRLLVRREIRRDMS